MRKNGVSKDSLIEAEIVTVDESDLNVTKKVKIADSEHNFVQNYQTEVSSFQIDQTSMNGKSDITQEDLNQIQRDADTLD